MKLSEIINHLGEERERYFNAVSPPVIQSSNFCFPTVDAMRKGLQAEFDNPVYTRGVNPTVTILRKKIAALEHAEDALVFSSGSAAIASAIIPNIGRGDHVVCVRKPYTWTDILLNEMLPRFGVETTMVDGRDPANFERTIRPETRLIYLESPNSLTFELQDLAAVVEIAQRHGILTICDNSYNTPLHQQPLDMGIDLVVHSATKFLAGHSDVVAGVVAGNEAMIRKIFAEGMMLLGGNPSPHDACLMIRGLRTLPVRMKQSVESAARITAFLESHPKAEKVIWPFLSSHEQFSLAKKQMSGCSSLFSVLLKAKDTAAIDAFCERLKLFLLAVSWGGFESLVFPATAMNVPGTSEAKEVPWNLVRFYIGLEEAADLEDDLRKALEKL
jgi:cystathionine beta-lyase/cystathionine gamma-synthase